MLLLVLVVIIVSLVIVLMTRLLRGLNHVLVLRQFQLNFHCSDLGPDFLILFSQGISLLPQVLKLFINISISSVIKF